MTLSDWLSSIALALALFYVVTLVWLVTADVWRHRRDGRGWRADGPAGTTTAPEDRETARAQGRSIES